VRARISARTLSLLTTKKSSPNKRAVGGSQDIQDLNADPADSTDTRLVEVHKPEIAKSMVK
jgi:hypothetical protein